MEKLPKVGVGVIVIKGSKVLLGKRKNAHGDGAWSFGGGHLEFGETIEECAEREVMEEMGIEVKNVRIGPVTNDIFVKEGKHYITVFVIAEHAKGTPKVMEPDRNEKWQWFEWHNLPRPLFKPIENLLDSKFNPFNV